MDKNKILYIGGFELPDKNAAAHRVLNNAKMLKEIGYEVSFIGVSKEPSQNSNLYETEIYEGFKTWSIPYPKGIKAWIRYVSEIEQVKRIIANSDQDFDIIICYNFPALALYKLQKYCRNNNIKVVADCTEWYMHKKTSMIGIIKHFDSEFRMKVLNKKCDGIICISRYLYNYYQQMEGKIVLPPLVDLDSEKWTKQISHEEIKEFSQIKLVYAGSPGADKDKINHIIDVLLNIDQISNKIEFNVIGISRDFYVEAHPSHSNKMDQIDQFTKFHGRIPHDNVIQIVKDAHFSIFLRQKTRVNMAGFPTKFAESISCGTPVLTNKTSDLEEYLIEGENGYWLSLVDPGKSLLQFEKILNLSEAKIKIMKENCEESRRFDYRNYTESMRSFLNKI